MIAKDFSIIIPAKNEATSLAILLPKIYALYPQAEIIIVDDGSTDNTADVAKTNNAVVVKHPYCIGNGGAIKSGVRKASNDVIVCMDADGQHSPEDIQNLLNKLEQGYDMAVGARSYSSQAGKRRLVGNAIYNKIASLMVGKNVEDLTSGFRAIKRDKFVEYLHLLPNGFSYPTTITMAFFRNGYSVAYCPITANKRSGKSHLKLTRDGIRFLLIIFKIGSLYSPLKIFAPASAILFAIGISYYAYTYFTAARFTNMSALLLISSLFVFLMGLISEQITALVYSNKPN